VKLRGRDRRHRFRRPARVDRGRRHFPRKLSRRHLDGLAALRAVSTAVPARWGSRGACGRWTVPRSRSRSGHSLAHNSRDLPQRSEISARAYPNGLLVGTSPTLSDTPPERTFLPSGYSGLVDEVRVRSLGSSMTGAEARGSWTT
jgi:hypothetical protein